jgi:hypothetical protein
MFFKKALAYSLFINLFFLGLCVFFGDPKFGAIDDYFMAARLTGALGSDYNPHLIFVNAIYGYVLLPLYHIFPKVGWYYIGEMFSVFLSLTVIGYILLQKCGERWGAILATLFTALVASDLYLTVQFTQCASILSAAGMLLFAYGITSRKRGDGYPKRSIYIHMLDAAPYIFGIILMLWGSVMRWQAFLMGLLFFCLCLAFIFRQCWQTKFNVAIGLAVLFTGAFAIHYWDQNLYKALEYENFNKFQGLRVALGDYRNYNQNAVYEDAEELGLSGKDFQMLTEWTFYDTQVFSSDSLKRYTDMETAYKDNVPKEYIPRQMLATLGNSLHFPPFWIWFVLSLVVFVTNKKKSLYIYGSLLLVLALMAYLLAMGRLIYRVESGLWLYASILAIPLFKEFALVISRKFLYGILGLIAVANIYSYASSGDVVHSPDNGAKRTIVVDDSTDYNQVFEYIDNQPDKMFLLSMQPFMRFSHHRNPPYFASPIGQYRRTVSLGYWTPYLPEVTQSLAEFGIDNPIKDVVHDNVIVLSELNLKDFLQRHYYDSVAIDTLKKIGSMTFLKYKLVDKASKRGVE